MVDVVLRGGTVVDGTGRPSRRADVAVTGNRVVAVGSCPEPAAHTVDVDGLVVAPGFIDPHVHYDAQVLWDPDLTPSSWHGVTTVVAGNCGFSVAPLGPGAADYLVRLLAAVEGMDPDALRAGASWDWVSFEQWMALVDRTTALNAAFFVGHSTVRRVVMGESATGPATQAQVRQMADLVGAALRAGAVGLSTSLNENHLDGEGRPVPSRAADGDELLTLAGVLASHAGSLVEFVPPMAGLFGETEWDLLTELSLAANAPVVWNSLAVDESSPAFYESLLATSPYAAERGARVVAMTIPDVSRLRLSFGNGMILQAFPGWSDLFSLSPESRLAALADPSVRARLHLGLDSVGHDGLFGRFSDFSAMRIGETCLPANAALNGVTVGEVAARVGRDPLDVVLDLVLAEGLNVGFWPPSPGDDAASWRRRAELWSLPDVVVGGGDAGAHLDAIDSFGYPAVLVGPVVRDRGLISLEEAVRLLTSVPASLFGLAGRGMVGPGAFADLVVFDPERVGPGPVELRRDLPAGAARLYAEATGIHHVMVNGSFVIRDGALTGARPGRALSRGVE